MRTSKKTLLSVTCATTLVAGGLLLPGCNKRVFEVVPRDCTQEQQIVVPAKLDVPADILVVIDNSGSMCEEQQNLAQNFFDPNCPIDVNNVQPEYVNPNDETVAQLAPNCGFVQLLAAYENDWRIGVITTDVGPCDNRYGFAETQPALTCDGTTNPNWGRRPQRGCLQPYDVGNNDAVLLQRGDNDVGTKFGNILANISTFGSPFERGLDAMRVFLSPNAQRAPGCEDHLDKFLRPDAKLVVIFVTDEDDCSHSDGAAGLPDENQGEACSNDVEEFYSLKDPDIAPDRCYTEQDNLTPVNEFASFLRAYKGAEPGQVSVAVIAGATRDGDEGVTVEGCVTGADGNPEGGCYESFGSSNLTGMGQKCNPTELANNGINDECCKADPGTRYYQLADAFGTAASKVDSICYDSFRQTMLEIAQFIARTDFVPLAEPPSNPNAIIVEVTPAGSDEPQIVSRIPDGEDPTGQNGWQYDGGTRINFYGDAAPGPGDSISVAALVNRENEGDYICGETAGDAGP